MRVAGIDFISHRQPSGRHHQRHDHLRAIGPVIPAVTETTLAVSPRCGRIAFEIGARQIVKQDVELCPEQLTPLPAQVVEQLVPMLDQQIQTTVRLVLLRQREILTQQIAQRRPLTPTEQNRLIASLQQARMACDAAGLVDKETDGSPKIDELADILTEVCLQSGLKAVVFSQWQIMTKMVESRLRRLGIGFVSLHGGVPTAKRGALMDAFREDDSVQVFLSTDAGGVGLNLQSGSVLINLDVPWNPAVLEQRNGRVHRLGQTRKVQIITMVGANSYEEQVLSLVRNKQSLFDNVISEDACEDVVGVSKKLLETLLKDLPATAGGDTEPALKAAPEEETPQAEQQETTPYDSGAVSSDGGDRKSVV